MRKTTAFINIPYSMRYEQVYLAYIAGLSAYGIIPIVALSDLRNASQLDRIVGLFIKSDYSFHELSWMGTDRIKPYTPRFNMPFELGLAVMNSKIGSKRHFWFVFDTVPHRLDKALSDLKGFRAYVHNKTPRGIFTSLMNALIRERHKPTINELLLIYSDVQRKAQQIKRTIGSLNLFDNRPFMELVVEANRSAHIHIASLRRT